MVKAGSIISSIEYNKPNEGRATTIKTTEGITVQTISITVPWTTLEPDPAVVAETLKNNKVRIKTTKTKNKINVIKNIKSWCKLTIPSITGVAGSWKKHCHGVDESSKNWENIERKNYV